MKVAILHYWFITRRGGEKVVESILKIFPDADIYTLFYDPSVYGNHLMNNTVYTSILNNKLFRKYYQKIFPLYPYGVKYFKLKNEYDLVISSESGPIKGIRVPENTPHICYIHSPMRYCWGFTKDYLNSMPKIMRPVASFFFNKLQKWDKTTINNVSHYVANSHNIAERVNRYYKRNAIVIHPPIALELFKENFRQNNKPEYYLSFGAITPYKRIDLLIHSFNKSGKKLVIIGNGSEKNKLEKLANKNIKFYGSLDWNEIKDILKNTRVLLFPGEEDFGMIPLEIMAFGIPVIAYRKGGALETIVENKASIGESSGLFFDKQSLSSLNECISYFEKVEDQFDRKWIMAHARKFGEDFFISNFRKYINTIIEKSSGKLID